MRAVLIVDDEIPSRELIKMSVDWPTLGYDSVLEARNGREALAVYMDKRPYLVITDIQMPVMDGLELIRAIRGEDAGARIAILSCHESFSYAKEALRLGVIDYLVKDQVTGESLINLLGTVCRWRPQPPDQAAPTALSEALGRDGPSSEALQAFGEALGGERCYFVCAARLSAALSADARDALSSRLASVAQGVQVEVTADALYLMCPTERSVSATRQLQDRSDIACALREKLHAVVGGPPTMGVSRVKRRPDALREAVDEARHAMNSFVFLGKGRNLYCEDACRQADDRQMQVLEQSIDAIRKALSARDVPLVQALIARLYQKELRGMLQYNYLQHINAVLLGILTQSCEANQIPYGRVFETDILSPGAVDAMDSIGEICDWYQARFVSLCAVLSIDYSPRMTGILRYIDQHFCSDVSLDTVARKFGMSKAYLAKVFKAQTGSSVNEYIRSLRIDRAKALLNERDARVGEVGEKLGFHNPQTFYNLFKRDTGLSPSEYKEQCDMKRVQRTLHQEEETK